MPIISNTTSSGTFISGASSKGGAVQGWKSADGKNGKVVGAGPLGLFKALKSTDSKGTVTKVVAGATSGAAGAAMSEVTADGKVKAAGAAGAAVGLGAAAGGTINTTDEKGNNVQMTGGAGIGIGGAGAVGGVITDTTTGKSKGKGAAWIPGVGIAFAAGDQNTGNGGVVIVGKNGIHGLGKINGFSIFG